MPQNVPAAGAPPDSIQIPFSRIATFVRQITHDVRNSLNSMDLQAAYVTELVTDPEAQEEVKRIRAIIQTSAKQLQALSAQFQSSPPSLIDYQAAILIEDLRERLAKTFSEHNGDIQWTVQLGREMVEVDVEMFFAAITELFRNAIQFRMEGCVITAHASAADGGCVLEISEKPSSVASAPEEWGREPFISSRRSGYGLGLFKTRRVIEQHRGTLDFSFDPGCAQLRTRVWLPLAATQ